MEVQSQNSARGSIPALVIVATLLLVITSCRSTQTPGNREDPNLHPGWPRANRLFHETSCREVTANLPAIEGAEYVHDDELCLQCHEAYTKAFATNVHHRDGCESCHGPASRHMKTRGQQPELVFSFVRGDPIVVAEACLRCHQQGSCSDASGWRTSKHAHGGVTCVDCHRAHYDVPAGTPATTPTARQDVRRLPPVHHQLASYQDDASWLGNTDKDAPESHDAKDDAPRQDAWTEEAPWLRGAGDEEDGGEDPAPGGAVPWGKNGDSDGKPRTASNQSYRGTSRQLDASSPDTCYRCHQEMHEMQRIAGPHQIGGPNGFQCTTCHDPHGNIRQVSRQELCLTCHNGAPTMAWHSTVHFESGVACTDCHNPHASPRPARVATVSHENVVRPQRRLMSVQQPEACYKCHQAVYGQFALPSHHPVREGKMVCSDCHDPHGQAEAGLNEGTINLTCYKCHAEKQGPFLFDHPPVSEDCTICHRAHGTVTDNLLRQPTTFLCLRCHSGHHNSHQDLGSSDTLRRSLYTNCTQCHAQVHGTDRISNSGHPNLTR